MSDTYIHPTTGAKVSVPTDIDSDDWPKQFGTDKKIKPCNECEHPMSYHAVALRDGKVRLECLCGCSVEGTQQ